MLYDREAWEITITNAVRSMTRRGITPETRVLGVGAPTPLHISNRMFGDLGAGRGEAPRLAVTMPIGQIVQGLNGYQPELLITYPSFMRRLAEEQRAGRLLISSRWMCSAAETLTHDVRLLVGEAFGVTVVDSYCTTETGLIGTECQCSAGVHVAEDLFVLEVVDSENRPVPPGVRGQKILVTTLFNRVLPLIRYEIADLVTLADGPCGCGWPHLRLASIQGRREDILTLPARDGGRVSVHALRLREAVLRMPAVRQFQVAPVGGGLHVRVVLGEVERPEELLESIRRTILAVLEEAGAAAERLTIEAAERIERAGTGAKEKLVSLSW